MWFSHHMFFTSARAERELGYNAQPYVEALSAPWIGYARRGDAKVAPAVFRAINRLFKRLCQRSVNI
jgi:hypothetical protein